MKHLIRAAASVFLLLSAITTPRAADPDALWKLISQQCVPHQLANLPPKPCAEVDLTGGIEHGFVVIKDLVGATQFLLLPTAKITGIESPAILAPDATNYFAAAWSERKRMDVAARRDFPRDVFSLTVNSPFGRSQNQLHIHIDCISADTHAALAANASAIGDKWAPFPVPLSGHPYEAMHVAGDTLDAVNPFRLLADGIPGAASDMAHQTVAAVGATLPDGRPGFILLTGHADAAHANTGSAEELQDHACRGV